MGANESKPQSSGKQHVFASSTPVHFSKELVDSLQGSAETDGTRQKTLELHIQSRVADELKRLAARDAELLKSLEDKISAEESPTSISSSSSNSAEAGKDAQEASARARDLGRESIQRDVDKLKKKLQSRRKLEGLDEGVERAKAELVGCLRENEKRPLDCWREVGAFKREVGRLEREFVDRALG
ncbi:MAG: hypothetical protein M1824_002046 [Vezdaea acicularis]|nr:MAG: hypothetical protein M1824_002046 [Vezdaea acicularis]